MGYFAVLTASKGVPDDAVAQVQTALGGTANRLSERAVEIRFDGEPLPIQLDGIDLNFIPAESREKQLLIADMDSTIITVECIDELADFAGKKDEVSDITERAMRGELVFEEALRARVSMLKGVTKDDIQTCFDTRVKLTDGATELVAEMNNRGVTALVSPGFWTSRASALKMQSPWATEPTMPPWSKPPDWASHFTPNPRSKRSPTPCSTTPT